MLRGRLGLRCLTLVGTEPLDTPARVAMRLLEIANKPDDIARVLASVHSTSRPASSSS